jgi:Na+-driven multidrug efflux pump
MTATIAPTAAVPVARHDHALLSAPILPTLLRLSMPNFVAMLVVALVAICETVYVGILGTTPLAGIALVFPLVMLMHMLSAGAMGGGVSSAISRALGAGDVARAEALALHAAVIGACAGLFFSVIFFTLGAPILGALGGSGDVLREALLYADVALTGAVLTWAVNTFASVLRGTGNMRVPSLTLLAASTVQIGLGGALGLGVAPIPQFGLAGVAWGVVIAYALAALFLFWYLRSGRGRLTLRFRAAALTRDMFADILKVGAVGVASVPIVGMAIGARRIERARMVAWTAAGLAATMLGAIGLVVMIAPDLWSGLFTDDSAVNAAANLYLRWAAPGFAFVGVGLSLYFASQGSGKVLAPVLAGTVRLLIVALGGWWLTASAAPAWSLFALVGASMVAFGLCVAAAVHLTSWDRQ